ncbi:amidoligase family protein [uncultured Cellulomonas sp.]|uniref:amidoligase family protein n=1 Tax=uncultured Cellulomonas sp. TaxID=189682 RepID=UPI0028E71060|nr:amidoligase family protein [uncultured Cellulomonas sp.]
MDELRLRTGFEIELLAPVGSDRQVLADELAARCGGRVLRSFHTDSEPSTVPGVGVFRRLSPAFDVLDADGRPVARLVDDITLEADLAADAPVPGLSGHRGWYRVLCDDARLLRLVERHADPDAPRDRVLDPVAALFGVDAEVIGTAVRVDDHRGATVAVAMPLPPGRERPCEIITPPLDRDHGRALERLLAPARELGFTVPQEAAVHLHVDGAPFRRPEVLANVVRLFGHWREALWAGLETNPACRRLAPLPSALLDLVERPGWTTAAARATGVTKYADVNLTQLLTDRPVRDTLEVRILPGDVDGSAIVRRAALVEALLARCLEPRPLPLPGAGATLDDLVGVRL